MYVGEPVYDLQSTLSASYGQVYNSFFRTFPHNDTIETIVQIPTQSMGEVCSKMVIGERHEFLLSFCETGSKVHIYMTTLIPFKPVTLGPFESAAKAINHVKIIDNILMIVSKSRLPSIPSTICWPLSWSGCTSECPTPGNSSTTSRSRKAI